MRRLIWTVLLGGIVGAGAFLITTDGLLHRDLACEQQSDERVQKLCRSLARNMEWSWTGHAILSPSFRVSIPSARRTFCQSPVTSDDTGPLIQIFLATQTRPGMAAAQLNNGSRFLLTMLGDDALAQIPAPGEARDDHKQSAADNLAKEIALAVSTPANIFNPSHVSYVLKGGCGAYDVTN